MSNSPCRKGARRRRAVFTPVCLALPKPRSRRISPSAAAAGSSKARSRCIWASKRPSSPRKKAHPAFLVENLPALKQKLAAAGVTLRDDEPLEGYDRIYVDDPFGNRLELMEPNSSP